MNMDFSFDEEIIRRLVERIIKLEVQQETLRRRVEEPFSELNCFGINKETENSKLVLWSRIMRLEEENKKVQKRLQELFANVMDFELQSRGDICHMHEQRDLNRGEISKKLDLKERIEKYFIDSGAYGMKFMATSNSLQIRIFWSFILFLSLTLCGYLVYDSSCRWLRTPPTVGHDSWLSLGLIPFPAVTVCPDRNIGSLYPLDSLIQRCNSSTCSSQIREILSAASYLCSSLIQNLPIQAWSNYFNTSSPELIEELMPSCYEDISSCRWPKRGMEHCIKAFQTVYIDNTVCYSYNLLPARNMFKDNLLFRPVIGDNGLLVRPDWAPDLLYPQDDMDNTVPLHEDSAGEKFKLTIQLEKKPFSQKLCTDHFEPYKIAVHLPWELPRPYLRLPLGHSMHIAVTPRRVTSSQSSSSCLLQAEGSERLQLFQHYSQANCQLECRVRCSLSLCGCVPLYLPHLMRGEVTWKAIARHFRKEIKDDLHDIITDHLYNFPGEEGLTDEVLQNLEPDCTCDCPPPCTTLTYHLDTQLIPLSEDRLKTNQSEVSIFYKEGTDLFRNTDMEEIFSFSDFAAHLGGLMALFTGLSMISLAELLFLIFSNISCLFNPPKTSSSIRYRKAEKNRTVQTEPFFITDSTLTLDL